MSTEITLRGRADFAGECRLTALATALRGKNNQIEWLVLKVCELRLDPEEFTCTVGVKVRRGYQADVALLQLPAAVQREVQEQWPSTKQIEPSAVKVAVDVVGYELLVEWRPFVEGGRRHILIPAGWPAEVLERRSQGEAAFRTRVRWLMTELMLARCGLESYRESL